MGINIIIKYKLISFYEILCSDNVHYVNLKYGLIIE